MNNFFTFINAILIIGALQGIVLGILLFSRKSNITANRIMSVLLFLFSISILLHVFSHSGILPIYDFHKILIGIIYVLAAPLIYFYVKALTVFRFSFRKKDYAHFLPFVCVLLFASSFFFNNSPEMYSVIKEIILAISFLIIVVYIVFANKILFAYSAMLKSNYSSIEKINLLWLRIFVLCFTVLWIFGGILDLFFRAISWDIVWMLCSIIIFLTGYFGFNQPEIFSAEAFNPEEKKESKKYEKSSLNTEMMNNYLQKLQTVMQEQKLFLENDLNLSTLAKKLGISTHHLSQILNEQLGMSFYDYINLQRIESAKKLLLDPEYANQTISSIGFEVGFNSLSAFNAAFKKFTKKTPSQYRKE